MSGMEAAPGSQDTFEGQDILDDYIERYSNWGRWGDDDEIGALNFVTPQHVTDSARLVRRGKVISMTLPYDANGPQTGSFRANPLNLLTASGTDHLAGLQDDLGAWGKAKGFGFSDDVLIIPNQSGTQWDALSHIFWRGKMYNGFSAAEVGAKGARRCGIEKWTETCVTRGVLLDVARHLGVDALDPGHAITAEQLDATAAAQGVDIRSGDAVIVRTGFLGARRGDWGDYAGGPAPGLSLHSAPWLHEHEVAIIATDTWGIEVRPNEIDLFQPLHIVALVHMGLAFGEIWDLESIAEDCAQDGVYEFQFVGPPLPITGAVGSPANLLAIK